MNIKNEEAKTRWMNVRMLQGYSFIYFKGLVSRIKMNIGIKCIETGEIFYFDWEI
jgi:hypothetical protein